MLGDVPGATIEFVGDVIFTLLPDRIGWHVLGAQGLGAAWAIAASFWPDRISPAAAAVVETLLVYPAILVVYSLARGEAATPRPGGNNSHGSGRGPQPRGAPHARRIAVPVLHDRRFDRIAEHVTF